MISRSRPAHWPAPKPTPKRALHAQSRNRRGGGGGGRAGRVPSSDTSHREISADLPGKDGQWRRNMKENQKGKVWNGTGGGGKLKKKMMGGLSFFFFFFFFFLFTFFFHFLKPLKFVLGLPKWEFSTGKKHFTPGKISGKMTLPPSEKHSSYASWFAITGSL